MPGPRSKPVGVSERPAVPPGLEEIAPDAFLLHATWEGVEVRGAQLARLDVVEPRLAELRLAAADVSLAHITHLTLDDAVVTGLEGAGVRSSGAVLRRVRLEHARLTGADCSLGELYEVTLADSRADYLSLNRGRLEGVHFVDCDLREADFGAARLRRVRFDRCDLSGAEFGGAVLDRCELRGCTLDGAKGVDALAGTAMPWSDIVAAAGVFAAALGIETLPDGEA